MFDLNDIMRREEEQEQRQREALRKQEHNLEDDLVQIRTLAGLEWVNKADIDPDAGVFDDLMNFGTNDAYAMRMNLHPQHPRVKPAPARTSPIRKSLVSAPTKPSPVAHTAAQRPQKLLKGFRIDAAPGSYLDLEHLW